MTKYKNTSMRKQLIVLCVSAIISTLLLSMGVFLLSISNVLGPYLKNNLVFTIKETSNNLNSKIVLLEDIILRLRKNEQIVNWLQTNGLGADSAQKQAITKQLVAEADLYSDKNLCAEQIPFIDSVYLFDNFGGYNRASYQDKVSSIQTQLDEQQTALYEIFLQQTSDLQVITNEQSINVLYVLYDNYMNSIGTVMFVLSRNAIEGLLEKANDFKDGFWIMFDKNGDLFMESPSLFMQTEKQSLIKQPNNEVSVYSGAGKDYLVYLRQMSLGLSVAIAIPSNQLSSLIYTAVFPYLFIMLLCTVIAAVILFWRMARITKPLAEIAGNLNRVAQQSFDVKLPEYNSRELSIISKAFNTMTDTVNHLINDVYEKRLIAKDSEIKMLQSQINPHFLYNVLHTISLKAKLDGNEDIHHMASSFAKLTQARLTHNADDKITLEQELQYVKFYLDLQKYRFEEKLQYHIIVQNNDLLKYTIPRLTVEMIVENAVVHGIEPKSQAGNVYVDVSEQNNEIVVIIEDDGVGFKQQEGEMSFPLANDSNTDKIHNHVALNIVYRLLQHFYGPSYGISIKSRKGSGTFVTIRIPKEEVNYDKSNDS